MSRLESRAAAWAFHFHEGQKRKYTGEPYWIHCGGVANLVREVAHTEEMLAAAWMHDLVEDTDVTLDEIRAEFGGTVAELVGWLTDVSRPEDGNRETRKAMDRRRLSEAPPPAKTIKVADLIDNVHTIVQHDPEFARVYLREKRLLLDEALCGADYALWAEADAIVKNALKELT